MIRKRLILPLLIALSGATPVQANHANALPLIETRTSTTSGWASFAIETDGSEIALDLEATNMTGATHLAIAEYTATDYWTRLSSLTLFTDKDGMLVEHHAAGADYREDSINRKSKTTRFALFSRINAPGTTSPVIGVRKVLIWWAGEGATYNLSIRGGDGVRILAVDQGDRAFFYRSHDIQSAAAVQYWDHERVEPYDVGFGARAQAGGELTIEVKDSLIFTAESFMTSVDALTISTPKGHRICTLDKVGGMPSVGPDGETYSYCDSYQVKGPDRAGPGDYVVRATGAGVADYYWGELYLAGADARLPAVP